MGRVVVDWEIAAGLISQEASNRLMILLNLEQEKQRSLFRNQSLLEPAGACEPTHPFSVGSQEAKLLHQVPEHQTGV